MIAPAALAVSLFLSTNIDDLFMLLGFFADPGYRNRQIVLGQYAGIGVLFAASLAASLIALVIPAAWVGLLGLAPIAIGLRKLATAAAPADAGTVPPPAGRGRVAAVTLVTIANGADNISSYTPALATRGAADITVIAAVFAVMTAVLLALAHALTHHPRLGAPIRRHGRRVAPYVLIALGAFILHDAGTLALLF